MKKSLQEFGFVSLPKALGGFALILLNIELIRYLSPQDFGAYYLGITIIVLGDAAVGSAFDMGVLRLSPLYRSEDPAYSVAIERAAILLKACLIAILGLAVVVFSDVLEKALFGRDDGASLVYIVFFASVTLIFLRSALVHLQVRFAFATYGLLDFIHFGVKLGGAIATVFLLGSIPETILLWFVIGPLISVLIFVSRYGAVFLEHPWQFRRAQAELLQYTKWYLATFALGPIISRLDILLLSALSSMTLVGIFSGAQAYALIPEVLGMYMSVVLSPRIIPLLKAGAFFPLYRKVQLALLAFALSLLAGALVLFEFFATDLFPQSFQSSAEILLVLLPGSLANMSTFPLALPFLMFVRPRFFFWMELSTLPLLLVAYLYAIEASGALGAAWVTTVSRLIKLGCANILALVLAKQGALPKEQ